MYENLLAKICAFDKEQVGICMNTKTMVVRMTEEKIIKMIDNFMIHFQCVNNQFI